MIRIVLKGIFIISLISVIAGCSVYQAPQMDIGKVKLDTPVEITVWVWPGTGLEPLIDQYQKNHPELKIIVQTAQFEDVHNNLQTAFAAGIGAPDICIIEVSGIERFKLFPDYFYNLMDYGAEDLREDYLDWKWQQALSNDNDGSILFGLPTDIGPIAMIYHTELFRQAGLPTDRTEVSKLISTWDNLLEAGKQVRERTGKAMFDNLNNLYRNIISQADRQYFDKETGSFIAETNPSVKRAWDYAVKASEMNLTASLTSWMPEWGAAANEGEFAVVLSPAWMMGFIKGNAPDASGKWDVTYLPEGSGNWGGSFLTMPKGGKHPEEAYALIQWLTAPRQQLTIFNNNGNFPSTPNIYDDPMISGKHDDYFSGAPVGKIYSETARRVKPVYEGPHSSLVHLAFEEALLKLEKKQVSPEKAWDDTMKKIKEQIKK